MPCPLRFVLAGISALVALLVWVHGRSDGEEAKDPIHKVRPQWCWLVRIGAPPSLDV